LQPNRRRQFKPVHARHLNVREQNVERFCIEGVQRFATTARDADAVPPSLQLHCCHLLVERIVFDDEVAKALRPRRHGRGGFDRLVAGERRRQMLRVDHVQERANQFDPLHLLAEVGARPDPAAPLDIAMLEQSHTPRHYFHERRDEEWTEPILM